MPKLVRADLLPPALADARSPKLMRVWDPLVRLFHWSLVAGFIVAWLSANQAEDIHIWVGYATSGLILLRLIWGFAGTRYARFSSFVCSPRTVFGYVRAIVTGNEARHIGHNPAGGVMVLGLMAGVLGLGLTGWMQFTDAYYGEDWVTELHGMIADGMVVLILVHLCGVVLASVRHRENLVRAMITGLKRTPQDHDIA